MIESMVMALGLVFVIEGLLYALVPGHLKHMMATIAETPEDRLRYGGVFAVAIGVGIVWIARSL